MLSALLVIAITTAVAIAAIGLAAQYLGFSLETPGQFREARSNLATLQAENATLVAESRVQQTQIAQILRQAGSDREQLDALQVEIESFSQLSDEVATRLAADSRERATTVSEMQTSREAVAVFATSEAGRAALLEELRRRSERVERFLIRLSDIAEDTALDIGNGTPTPAPFPPTLTPTLEPFPTPTATPAIDLTLSPTPLPVTTTITPATSIPATPTAIPETRTPTPRATPTEVDEEEEPTETPEP
jgi:hypothetical protein